MPDSAYFRKNGFHRWSFGRLEYTVILQHSSFYQDLFLLDLPVTILLSVRYEISPLVQTTELNSKVISILDMLTLNNNLL